MAFEKANRHGKKGILYQCMMVSKKQKKEMNTIEKVKSNVE